MKRVFLKIWQNSRENIFVRASFLISLTPATLLKKKPRHRCFLVNFAKLLREPFLHRQIPLVASVKPKTIRS